MRPKAMVIGLGPEYNYNPTDHGIWQNDTTRYASNHGASLICRSLMRLFDADYVDIRQPPENLHTNYDLCVLAFATHVTDWRDVTAYASFVRELNLKTVAFSMGIQDKVSSSAQVPELHESMRALLELVLERSGMVGVRCPQTAQVLRKSGISQDRIVCIGCPTMFSTLDRGLRIEKPEKVRKPLIVYQRFMADLGPRLLSGAPLLGQDFLDEAVFTDRIEGKHSIDESQRQFYSERANGALALNLIRENGVFPRTFDEWYSTIGSHDFVLGSRLHGCIAALLQGIPAVLLTRDARTLEMAKFMGIPYLTFEQAKDLTPREVFERVQYDEFNRLYPLRFDNFVWLMNELGLVDRLQDGRSLQVPAGLSLTDRDRQEDARVLHRELAVMQHRITDLEHSINLLRSAYHKLKRVPVVGSLFRRLIG